MQPIERQWVILRMLPRSPRRIDTRRIEAAFAALGIRVHRRTIQRDLVLLARVFPIACDEAHKPFGWAWLEGATLPAVVKIGRARP